MAETTYLVSLDGGTHYELTRLDEGSSKLKGHPVPWWKPREQVKETDYAFDDRIEADGDNTFVTRLYVIKGGKYKTDIPVRLCKDSKFSHIFRFDASLLSQLDEKSRKYLSDKYIHDFSIAEIRKMGACVARGIPSENFFEVEPPAGLADQFHQATLRYVRPVSMFDTDAMAYIHFTNNYPVAVTKDLAGKEELKIGGRQRCLAAGVGFLTSIDKLALGRDGYFDLYEFSADAGGTIDVIRRCLLFLYNRDNRGMTSSLSDSEGKTYGLRGFSIPETHALLTGLDRKSCARIFGKLAKSDIQPLEKQKENFWTKDAGFRQDRIISCRPIRYIWR